ncbi:hypothetical protein AAMO2058_000859800 [Amorphochlora amoebiformis]
MGMVLGHLKGGGGRPRGLILLALTISLILLSTETRVKREVRQLREELQDPPQLSNDVARALMGKVRNIHPAPLRTSPLNAPHSNLYIILSSPPLSVHLLILSLHDTFSSPNVPSLFSLRCPVITIVYPTGQGFNVPLSAPRPNLYDEEARLRKLSSEPLSEFYSQTRVNARMMERRDRERGSFGGTMVF